ncbi:calpain-9 [Bombina bombina]|uniref:calpain-9 n=1 Tax=Bombina bombina TaxID=8345 RepID=UPI00235AEDC4|nr:calpain-9 [Bombina bombina]
MPYIYKEPKQQPSVPEEARCIHSSGKSYEELRRECLKKGTLFEDPDFPANDASLFYSEKPNIPFEWKRPKEIVKDPEFILGGASRTDVCQGDLGDCWLLAATASLTLNEKVLNRVVPPDQNFGSGYAGIFHFQFWQHNEWVDVVIDDRLPTFRNRLVFLHSADLNEFWSALMEKAYAKLNGSYEALKGGSTIEAMEDFTGGVAETYETKSAPDNFYDIMDKALKRGSMLGCSIDITSSAETEAKTPQGLVKGHAYSITGLDVVNFRGQKVKLIRVRNPWGQVEWNGPWSDNSSEWNFIDAAEKNRLCQKSLDDGEFWMKIEDFKRYFDKVEICNLTPDALDNDTLHKWEVMVHEGSWVRGSTAGGCRNFLETFWTNPQIKLILKEKDEGQNECTFIAALMQKNRRKLRKVGADLLTIGYAIYQCPGTESQLKKEFFKFNPSKARSKTYINLREISQRFKLPPGEYMLVPTTFEPHQEADFCLRIFSENKAKIEELDGNIIVDLPDPPKPTPPQKETEEERQFRSLFEQISGEDMEVSPEELQYILNAVLRRTKNIKFKEISLLSCSNIISLMDSSGNGKLEFDEFKVFWDKLKNWIGIFLQFDTDKSGTMSSYELRLALKAAGFQLNNIVLQLVVLRYADDSYQIEFDDFLNCLIRLENSSRVFQTLKRDASDKIVLNQAEFICLAMNI